MKSLLKLAAMLLAVAMFAACSNTATEAEEEIVDEITTEEVITEDIVIDVEEEEVVAEEVAE